MTLIVAARQELASSPDLTDLLGSDETWDTWIFRWKPYVTLEGTGKSMVVLSLRGSWASANNHNTARFPRLQVEIFSDPARTSDGRPVNATAEDDVNDIFEEVDYVLHVPQGGDLSWGDGEVRVLSSLRNEGDVEITEVPGGDGMARGLVSYAVSLG